MNTSTIQRKSYLKRLSAFYFAPLWQSFFRIFYLVFFAYFAIFHFGKIIIALKFIFYTLWNGTLLLGLPYLFWGVIFVITLIIPFSVSLYAIFLLYEIWISTWEYQKKILMTALVITAIPLIIIIMDDVIRLAASQDVLREFVVLNEIRVSGK